MFIVLIPEGIIPCVTSSEKCRGEKSFRSFGISDWQHFNLFMFVQNGFKVIFWDGAENGTKKAKSNPEI